MFVVEQKHLILAKRYFSESEIRAAREQSEPLEYLRKLAVEQGRGEYSQWPIARNIYGYSTQNGQVHFLGLTDGRLDFGRPVLSIPIEHLAMAALLESYQLTFLSDTDTAYIHKD